MRVNQPTKPQAERQSFNWLSLTGLILAVILPPVGLIVSVVAWVRTARRQRRGLPLAIIGTVISLLLTAIIAGAFIIAGSVFITDANKPNQAQTALQPVQASLEQIGGRKLCDKGDNGYSLDNGMPWYQVEYSVPSTNLLQTLKSSAQQQGFNLVTDPNTPHQANLDADYFTATAGGKKLDVQIARTGTPPAACQTTPTATPEQNLVLLGLMLPENP